MATASASVAMPLQGTVGSPPYPVPDKILIWSPGRFRGDFGECVWDDAGAQSVLAAYEARGNPLPIDLEHNTNLAANPGYNPSQPPEGGGYGWIRVEHGPGGPSLWLDPIQWSGHARQQIESGSRRCISPDWDYDPTTGRVLRLKKVSLVQNPGTYGIGLIASARGRETGMDEKLKMLLAALKAALTSENPTPALQALISEVEGILGGGGGDPSPVGDLPPMPEPAAAGDGNPLEDEQRMARAVASALQQLGLLPSKGPTATLPSAPKGLTASAVTDLVRKEMAERDAKRSLIASARKDGRPMTDALEAQIVQMPLAQARAVVAALPRPEPSSSTSATAASDDKGVKVGPHGTTTSATTPAQAREAASIQAIQRAARPRADRIAEARAGATDKDGRPIVSEQGAYAFSALSQMRARPRSSG